MDYIVLLKSRISLRISIRVEPFFRDIAMWGAATVAGAKPPRTSGENRIPTKPVFSKKC
jgi:hypothetical protein